jgi:glutamine synthetase
MDKEGAIITILKKYASETRRIRFEGNSYGDAWIAEAEGRGLSNVKSSAQALKSFISPSTMSLFDNLGILNQRELHARYEIRLEHFIKKIQIESRVMGDLATNHIIPTAIRYQNTLIDNVKGLREVLDQKTFLKLTKTQLQTIRDISEHIMQIRVNVGNMIEARKIAYDKDIRPFFDIIRRSVDKLELLVDDELWPLPKYRELMFLR